MIEPRQALVAMDPRLWSSHLWGDGTRARLEDTTGGDLGPAIMIAGLLVLRQAVADEGGCLYVIQLIRSWADQQKAYDEGRSQVGPGLSTHQSGRGGDLEWTGITDEQFGAIAAGLGWTTIPNDGPHWELRGVWQRLRDAQGPEQMAMAMVLDGVGLSEGQTYEGRDNYGTDEVAALQTQLWRCHKPGCGAIDGWLGDQTRAALRALGMAEDAGYRDLHRLVSAS